MNPIYAFLSVLVLLTGCEYPRDTNKTFERIQGGVLRVGVVASEPWKTVESGLLGRFANENRTKIEWIEGTESDLLKALEYRELDVVIGGIQKENLLADKAGLTYPYYEAKVKIGSTEAKSVKDFEDKPVQVENGRSYSVELRKKKANPHFVKQLSATNGAAAGYDFELDSIGLKTSFDDLRTEKHVIAVLPGENRLLIELENFLRKNESAIQGLLHEASRGHHASR